MPSWLWWIIIGVAAGWIAGQVMKGSGYGLLGDLVIGAIGGLIGGYVFGLLKIPSSGIWGALLTAVIGAILLIAIVRGHKGREKVVWLASHRMELNQKPMWSMFCVPLLSVCLAKSERAPGSQTPWGPLSIKQYSCRNSQNLAPRVGLEPTTPGLTVQCYHR